MQCLKSITGRIVISMAIIFLCACSGEGGVDGTGLHGTAATGAPIANTVVALRDKSGAHRSASTNAAGQFAIDVAGLTPPYLLQTATVDGAVYYTVATATGVANINPLTDVAARNWFLAEGRDIAAEFAGTTPMAVAPDEEEVNGIVANLMDLFALAYDAFGVKPDFNFQRQAFAADHTGFDQLLDFTSVAIVDNKLTITLTNPVHNSVTVSIVIAYDLHESFNRADAIKPSTPNALSVIAANAANDAGNMVLLWNPATDNVGVTGYRIYHGNRRDGDYQLIGATPFAYFIHAQAAPGESHCYAVSAIDGFGNESTRSDAACGQVEETSAPPTPANSHYFAFAGQSYSANHAFPEYANNAAYSLQWILASKPPASQLSFPARLPGVSANAIEFTPDVPGDYRFEWHVIEIASAGTIVVHFIEYTVETLPVADAGPDRSGLVEEFIGVEAVLVDKPYPVRYVWTLVKAPLSHNAIVEGTLAPFMQMYTATPGDYEFTLGIEVMPEDVWIAGPLDSITITVKPLPTQP